MQLEEWLVSYGRETDGTDGTVTCDPRVAISITDQDDAYEQVVIRGRAVEQTTSGADTHIDKLAKKYLGKEKFPWREPGEKRIIFRMEPRRISE